jgi:hypothetical protein
MSKKTLLVGLFLLVILTGNVLAQNVPGTRFDLNNITGRNDYVIAVNILNGDIFRTFTRELSNYDTDLKKEIFLASEDAKPYIQRINDLKSILRNQGLTAVMVANDAVFSNYDTSRNGFWITIGNTEDGYYKPSINSYIYNRLSVVEEKNNLTGITYYKIFIPVNRDIGVKIDGRRDLRVKLQMKISSTRNVSFSAGGWRFNLTYPVADTLKIIIYNAENVFIEHDI